jgi:hypothetical protein
MFVILDRNLSSYLQKSWWIYIVFFAKIMSTVHFLLLDETSLQPYKNTKLDSVEVAANTNVIKFKKLVKAENQNKLALIDASDLTVYKNRAEFDATPKRVMDEEDPVSGLGASKKDALIVVVPAGIFHSNYSPRR